MPELYNCFFIKIEFTLLYYYTTGSMAVVNESIIYAKNANCVVPDLGPVFANLKTLWLYAGGKNSDQLSDADYVEQVFMFTDFSILATCNFKLLTWLNVHVDAKMTDYSVFYNIKTLTNLGISIYGNVEDKIHYVELPDNITNFSITRFAGVHLNHPGYCQHQHPGPNYVYKKSYSFTPLPYEKHNCRYIHITGKLKVLTSDYYVINLYEHQLLTGLSLYRVHFTNGEFPEICLPELVNLSISNTNLTTIPNLTSYKKLKTFAATYCAIKTIPDHFTPMFAQLTNINLNDNELTKLVIPANSVACISASYNFIYELTVPAKYQHPVGVVGNLV